jgi:hypothetical protein
MRGICPEVLECGSGVLVSEQERDGAVGLDKEEFGSSWMQPGEIVRATARRSHAAALAKYAALPAGR